VVNESILKERSLETSLDAPKFGILFGICSVGVAASVCPNPEVAFAEGMASLSLELPDDDIMVVGSMSGLGEAVTAAPSPVVTAEAVVSLTTVIKDT